MTIIQELNKAEVEYGEAKKSLEDWMKGKHKGERLNELEEKLFNEEWEDEKEMKKWKDKVDELKKEKESLEESKKRSEERRNGWDELYRKELSKGGGIE